MGSYLHRPYTFPTLPYTIPTPAYTEYVKRLTGLTVKAMITQSTKEYLKRMYERDMSNEQKIISRLDQLLDLMRELLDSNLRGLENQDYAKKQFNENRVIAFKVIPVFEDK